VARRVAHLSTTFRRSVTDLGLAPGSPGFRAVFATVAALTEGKSCLALATTRPTFAPGRAFARRVSGRNVWILFRFDDHHLFALTARGVPPVPVDS